MAFLAIDELNTNSIEEIRDMITRNDDTILEAIISESIDVMKSYIDNYYDSTAVFEATGNDRSLIVLKYLKDIVLFELYARDPISEMNAIVEYKYEQAMSWLNKVSMGKVAISLPTLDTDTDGDGEADGGFLWLKKGNRYESDF